MKVAFFGTHGYDHDSFNLANQSYHHELTFFEPRLTPETISLAKGFPVVCVFVNDKLQAPELEALASGQTRMIALRCAGFNNVDLPTAKQLGLTVARVPAYSPYAVAEHTLALILTLNRKTHKAYNRVREGNFALDGLTGFDLYGKTVGVIGTGKIGAILCKILAGFGCKILAYDVRENPEVLAVGGQYASLEQLLPACDIVSLHCPLTPQTRYIINEQTLKQMKPGVMLINTGRGALIDTAAVIAALKQGQIGLLGLDVYEEEEGVFFQDLSLRVLQDDVLARLITFPNVLITGHQAFLTREALGNIADTTLANITRFEKGEPCPNRL